VASELKPIQFEARIQRVEELRRSMGTHPDQDVPLRTEFHRGVEGITVKLLDHPTTPYRAFYDMATATWGKKIDKWPDASPQARHAVVKAILDYKSLPNAMESISFTFAVEGCSRSAFDQIARARIGVVIGSMGWRDNDHSDASYRVAENVWRDPEARRSVMEIVTEEKRLYHNMVNSGQHNYQNARGHLGIFFEHRFAIAFNYMALRNFMAKRLKFCEQEDTVAVAWLIRDAVGMEFPLLADHLVPSCDVKARCDYHEAESMSEAFGALFRGCGRWPDPYPYATFNESCSDESVIAAQTKLHIPTGPDARAWIKSLEEWANVHPIDQERFEAEE
jgi:thymidylate synthase ThyX